LENPKWDWRTIDGIAEEIGISPQRVASILALLPNVVDIVQSAVPDKRGRLLFTTRNHYFKRQNIANRILSAFSVIVVSRDPEYLLRLISANMADARMNKELLVAFSSRGRHPIRHSKNLPISECRRF
jgi:hypothetical protein